MSKYRQGYKPKRSVKNYEESEWLKPFIRKLLSVSPLSPDNPIHEKYRKLDDKNLTKEERLELEADIVNSVSIDSGGLLGKIKVYHGAGSLFDEWDWKRAYSGEGANQYGHGAYLAENPKVAQSYQQQEAHKKGLFDTYKGKPIEKTYDTFNTRYSSELDYAKMGVLEDLMVGSLYDEVLESTRQLYKDEPSRVNKSLLNWVEKDLRKNYKSGGYLYEMELKHRPNDYLQWDLPLQDQPKGVLNKIDEMVGKGLLNKPENPKHDFGNDIYWKYSKAMPENPKQFAFSDNMYQASKNLADNKIYGIRYKDQGSRMQHEEPTYNYVVFPTTDPEMIKIKGLLE